MSDKNKPSYTNLDALLARLETLRDLLELHVAHHAKLAAHVKHSPRIGRADGSQVVTTAALVCESGCVCWHCGAKNLCEETKAALATAPAVEKEGNKV